MSDNYTGIFKILKSDIERYLELKKEILATFYTNDGKLIDKDNYDPKSLIAEFRDSYAKDGHFIYLEELCRKLHVPYDRWTEAYTGDKDSYTAYYRPDMDEEQEIYAEGDGSICFNDKKLKQIAKEAAAESKEKGKEYLLCLGEKFDDFLTKIPNIKPLITYEGYIHKNNYLVIFADADYTPEFRTEHAKKAAELAIKMMSATMQRTGITLYLPGGLKVYKTKEYKTNATKAKPVYIIDKTIQIN